MKIFVVIPTIRDLTFLKSWKDEFRNCELLIIEDRAKKTIKIPRVPAKQILHFCWEDIQKDFGGKEWIFSRRNAGIRSYGFWKAYQLGADVIVTLDDDCYPTGTNFIQRHLDNLTFKAPTNWQTTYPDPRWMFTRGIPYSVRNKIPIMVSHGLWSGALDLDAKTEVKLSKLLHEDPYPPIRQIIPFGYFYPMCSMNLAFRREVVPLMFFPMMGYDPNGKKWLYDRYDDIWAGIFSKKIMDHLNWGVVNGSPFVQHKKASLPHENLKREYRGMNVNETLWKKVDKVTLTKKTPSSCYIELAKKMDFPKNRYFELLRKAMIIWGNLF